MSDTAAPLVQLSAELAARATRGSSRACPMARTFDVLGTKTAYLLVREAFYGATRFEEFVERTQVSEPVAAARLKELVDEGILERIPYQDPGQRTRQGYGLTEKGADLLPVFVAMMRWGNRYLFPGGPQVELTHSGCGQPVRAEVECTAGHTVLAGELDLSLHPRVKPRD